MDNEMKDFAQTATPTLTFEPFKEETPLQTVPDTKEEVSAPALDESSLTMEERKMVKTLLHRSIWQIPIWFCSMAQGRRRR